MNEQESPVLPELTPEQIEGYRIATDTMNHYVRNQLGLISGYSEIIGEDESLPDHLKDAFLEVQLSVRKIERVVKELSNIDPKDIKFKSDSPTGRPYLDLDDKID